MMLRRRRGIMMKPFPARMNWPYTSPHRINWVILTDRQRPLRRTRSWHRARRPLLLLHHLFALVKSHWAPPRSFLVFAGTFLLRVVLVFGGVYKFAHKGRKRAIVGYELRVRTPLGDATFSEHYNIIHLRKKVEGVGDELCRRVSIFSIESEKPDKEKTYKASFAGQRALYGLFENMFS
jgi:hypothetical protein